MLFYPPKLECAAIPSPRTAQRRDLQRMSTSQVEKRCLIPTLPLPQLGPEAYANLPSDVNSAKNLTAFKVLLGEWLKRMPDRPRYLDIPDKITTQFWTGYFSYPGRGRLCSLWGADTGAASSICAKTFTRLQDYKIVGLRAPLWALGIHPTWPGRGSRLSSQFSHYNSLYSDLIIIIPSLP